MRTTRTMKRPSVLYMLLRSAVLSFHAGTIITALSKQIIDLNISFCIIRQLKLALFFFLKIKFNEPKKLFMYYSISFTDKTHFNGHLVATVGYIVQNN